MDRPFVAADFIVPQRVEQANYLLRPFTTDDVEHDYAAVMSSKELLRRIFHEYDRVVALEETELMVWQNPNVPKLIQR